MGILDLVTCVNETPTDVLNEYNNRDPVATNFTGRVGTCQGAIKAAGLAANCSEDTRSWNALDLSIGNRTFMTANNNTGHDAGEHSQIFNSKSDFVDYQYSTDPHIEYYLAYASGRKAPYHVQEVGITLNHIITADLSGHHEIVGLYHTPRLEESQRWLQIYLPPLHNKQVPAIQHLSLAVQQKDIITVFESHYEFLGATLGLMTLCILVVIPLFNSFRKFGRDVSLNPLEIAKAMDAEMLREQGSNSTSRHLAKAFAGEEVQYEKIIDMSAGRSVEKLGYSTGYRPEPHAVYF
ncbi:hypothetical protein BJ878DRAFT_477069 [Calycina marina]|uniref:Uncharacterized protein n=1 Tax=Calycina marina TaxID=1763456 RepID=A0A9P7Z950_9HELO|nr:hypothetical protein BJ878DRAFT_477069 [Calycina marina]